MNIEIAKTREDISAIRELRDLINGKELGKAFLKETDQTMDETATLLCVKEQQQIIASLRCRFIPSSHTEMSKWGLHIPGPLRVAIADRLVVAQAYRHSRAAYLLVTGIYRQALIEGAKLAFIECEKHLILLYQKLGFQVYRETKYIYGVRYQLFINPWDLEALEKANSPFLKAHTQYMEEVNSFVKQLQAANRA